MTLPEPRCCVVTELGTGSSLDDESVPSITHSLSDSDSKTSECGDMSVDCASTAGVDNTLMVISARD